VTDPWNCWPSGLCLPPTINIVIGLAIGTVFLALIGINLWRLW
jgi:hypothetical protein